MGVLLKKLTSGKFLLTMIAGIVFAYAVYSGKLNDQAIATIVAMVFISYFQKKGDNNGNSDKDSGRADKTPASTSD